MQEQRRKLSAEEFRAERVKLALQGILAPKGQKTRLWAPEVSMLLEMEALKREAKGYEHGV